MAKVLCSTLSIQYGIEGGLHEMNAFVENKCNKDFLDCLTEYARIYQLEIEIDSVALCEGSVIKKFKVFAKEHQTLTGMALTGLIFLLSTNTENFLSHVWDKMYEDEELIELQKEELRAHIEYLRSQTPANEEAANSNKIAKKKSDFYKSADSDPQVTSVSFSNEDVAAKHTYTYSVQRGSFDSYILKDNNLDDETIEEATIVIVAPVLDKSNLQWRGLYEGLPIYFKMRSAEFRTKVLNGEISFKNGSAIKCKLVIHKALNDEGDEKITGYDVLLVHSVLQDAVYVETLEGKAYRKKKELDNSPHLFSQLDDLQ